MTHTTTIGSDIELPTVAATTEKAKEAGADLKQQASTQLDNAAHMLAEKADQRKGSLTKQARALEDELHKLAAGIREDQPKLGELVDTAVERGGHLIDWIEKTPIDDMTTQLNRQVYRHPALFAAGMFAAGFAITRVLKPVDSATTTTVSGGAS
jgi:hypothetical protein